MSIYVPRLPREFHHASLLGSRDRLNYLLQSMPAKQAISNMFPRRLMQIANEGLQTRRRSHHEPAHSIARNA